MSPPPGLPRQGGRDLLHAPGGLRLVEPTPWRGGAELKTDCLAVTAIPGLLKYFEDSRPTTNTKFDGSSRNAGKRGTNPARGGRSKDIFEMASNNLGVNLLVSMRPCQVWHPPR
jgi:hypothetical protein